MSIIWKEFVATLLDYVCDQKLNAFVLNKFTLLTRALSNGYS